MSERPTGLNPDPAETGELGRESHRTWHEDGDEAFDDILPPAELARMRRRDHDAGARERALMSDGSAKWFKQVLDRQERVAREARQRRHGA